MKRQDAFRKLRTICQRLDEADSEASTAVLRADKELLVFSIVSSVGILIVTTTFALPMLLAGFFDALVAGNSQVLGTVVALLF
jgi:hypothetical protein